MSRPLQFTTIGIFSFALIALGVTDAMLTGEVIAYPNGLMNQSSSILPGSAVLEIVRQEGFEVQDTNEASFIRTVIPEHLAVISKVLLRENDRVAFLAYSDAPDIKTAFFNLKTTFNQAFSQDIDGLVDDKQEPEGKPPRDVLTFRDRAIHSERLVFVRSGNRLYELHVVEGQEEVVNALLERLTE
jgi:hypothetical protein